MNSERAIPPIEEGIKKIRESRSGQESERGKGLVEVVENLIRQNAEILRMLSEQNQRMEERMGEVGRRFVEMEGIIEEHLGNVESRVSEYLSELKVKAEQKREAPDRNSLYAFISLEPDTTIRLQQLNPRINVHEVPVNIYRWSLKLENYGSYFHGYLLNSKMYEDKLRPKVKEIFDEDPETIFIFCYTNGALYANDNPGYSRNINLIQENSLDTTLPRFFMHKFPEIRRKLLLHVPDDQSQVPEKYMKMIKGEELDNFPLFIRCTE